MNPRAASRRPAVNDVGSTRLALLHAAIDLLVDRGFAALTTPRLAETAGFSRGAFQHHFASRDDLLIQLHEFIFEAELPRIPEDAASLPLDERVEILVWFLEENAASKWHAAAMALRKGIDSASPVGRAIEQRSYDQIERIHTQVAGLFPDVTLSRAEWATLIRALSGEIYGSSLYIQWKPRDVVDVEAISSRALRRRMAKMYFREITS